MAVSLYAHQHACCFPRDGAAEADLLAGLPFINMELVDQEAFQQFTEKTFATDRDLVPKGMIEVIL